MIRKNPNLKKLLTIVIMMLSIPLFQNVLKAQDEMQMAEELRKKFEPLKMFVGNWRQNFAFTQQYKEPIYGKGMYENQMIWAEVILEMTINTEYPIGTTVSKIILGYDRFRKVYFFLNYDAYGTYPMLARGSYDEKKREFVFKGENFISDKKSEPFKAVIRFERDTKFIYELYKGENNFKVLETICTKTN